MTSTTDRAQRRRTLREQRRMDEQQSRAMQALDSLAESECRRLRVVAVEPSEIAARAMLRMMENDRESFAALGSLDVEQRNEAMKRARMVARSEASNAQRSTLVERIADNRSASGEASNVEQRRAAVAAALESDGRVTRADRDQQRGYALLRAEQRGYVAAKSSGATSVERIAESEHKAVKRERRAFAHIAEYSTDRAVYLIREQSLETMLADLYRLHPERSTSSSIETDRLSRAAMRRAVRDALASDRIGGRAGSARRSLAGAVERAERRSVEQREQHQRALDALAVAALLDVEQRRAAAVALSKREPRATKRERSDAASAVVESERRAEHASSAAAILRASGDRWSLAGALLAAVETTERHDAGPNQSERSESSSVEWGALAASFGFDQSKPALDALRAFVREALSALDSASGDAVAAQTLDGRAASGAAKRRASSIGTERLAVEQRRAASGEAQRRAMYAAIEQSAAANRERRLSVERAARKQQQRRAAMRSVLAALLVQESPTGSLVYWFGE